MPPLLKEYWSTREGNKRLLSAALILLAYLTYNGFFGQLPEGWTGELIPGLLAIFGLKGIPLGQKNEKLTTEQLRALLVEMETETKAPPPPGGV